MDSLGLFRNPAALFLLVVPAALLVFTWRRSGRALVLPFDHSPARSKRFAAFFLRLAESVPALLLAIAIFLLASPQAWEEPRSKRALTNIQVCVDVSGSMAAPFDGGTRYEVAMRAMDAFLDQRKGDAFGLSFFGNTVLHWVPLTTDTSAFRCAAPFMKPGQLPRWFGGTEIGRALLACKKVLLEREDGDRMIVLVTDGYSADLAGGRDEEIARDLKRDGIPVYTIHIAPGEIPDSVVRIATITGGEAFKPEDGASLERVFARIDQMQRSRIEKAQSEATDHFTPWCLAGLGLLGLLALAAYGLRYTPW